jgi:hypothetical protein
VASSAVREDENNMARESSGSKAESWQRRTISGSFKASSCAEKEMEAEHGAGEPELGDGRRRPRSEGYEIAAPGGCELQWRPGADGGTRHGKQQQERGRSCGRIRKTRRPVPPLAPGERWRRPSFLEGRGKRDASGQSLLLPLLLLLQAKKRNTGEEGLLHRVAKIVEPDKAEAGGLARHPSVVEGLVKLSEEVPQVALLRIVGQAADVHLETLRHHHVSRGVESTGKASRCAYVRKMGEHTPCTPSQLPAPSPALPLIFHTRKLPFRHTLRTPSTPWLPENVSLCETLHGASTASAATSGGQGIGVVGGPCLIRAGHGREADSAYPVFTAK